MNIASITKLTSRILYLRTQWIHRYTGWLSLCNGADWLSLFNRVSLSASRISLHTNSQGYYDYPYSNTQDTQGPYTQSGYPQGSQSEYTYTQGYPFAQGTQEGYPLRLWCVGTATQDHAQKDILMLMVKKKMPKMAPRWFKLLKLFTAGLFELLQLQLRPAEPYSPFSNITVLSEDVNYDAILKELVVTIGELEDELYDPDTFQLVDRLGLPSFKCWMSSDALLLNNQIADLIRIDSWGFPLGKQ